MITCEFKRARRADGICARGPDFTSITANSAMGCVGGDLGLALVKLGVHATGVTTFTGVGARELAFAAAERPYAGCRNDKP